MLQQLKEQTEQASKRIELAELNMKGGNKPLSKVVNKMDSKPLDTIETTKAASQTMDA